MSKLSYGSYDEFRQGGEVYRVEYGVRAAAGTARGHTAAWMHRQSDE